MQIVLVLFKDEFSALTLVQWRWMEPSWLLLNLRTRAHHTSTQHSIRKRKSILVRVHYCSASTNAAPRVLAWRSLCARNSSTHARLSLWLLRLRRRGWNRKWLMFLLLWLLILNITMTFDQLFGLITDTVEDWTTIVLRPSCQYK